MRILLDTSFLLPSLGVEVAGAAEALENLKKMSSTTLTSAFLNACGLSHPSKGKKLRLKRRSLRWV